MVDGRKLNSRASCCKIKNTRTLRHAILLLSAHTYTLCRDTRIVLYEISSNQFARLMRIIPGKNGKI